MLISYTQEELAYVSNWVRIPVVDYAGRYVVFYKYEGTDWFYKYFDKEKEAKHFYDVELSYQISLYRSKQKTNERQRGN